MENIQVALNEFTRDISVYGPAERLVLDSPTIVRAIESAWPEKNTSSKLASTMVHGTKLARWMFPFVTLLVPVGDPSPELLEHSDKSCFLREEQYPEQLKHLLVAMVQ